MSAILNRWLDVERRCQCAAGDAADRSIDQARAMVHYLPMAAAAVSAAERSAILRAFESGGPLAMTQHESIAARLQQLAADAEALADEISAHARSGDWEDEMVEEAAKAIRDTMTEAERTVVRWDAVFAEVRS